MQPAQRPTVPQDAIFLNRRMQKSPGAGWRPQPVHTCCPTDWPVCLRPSRDNAVFGVEFSVKNAISTASAPSIVSAQYANSTALEDVGSAFKINRGVGR